MTDNRTFAGKLRVLREGRGLSQRALGRLCGISGAAVSLFESGQSYATWPTVQLLARALGVTCQDLQDDGVELPPSEPPRKRGRPRKAPPAPQAEPPPEEPKPAPKGRKKRKEN